MTNREFDRWLRASLSAVQPESFPDWEVLRNQLEDAESGVDADFDEAIRAHTGALGLSAMPDWDHMEHLLETDEHQFDENVRETIEQYEPRFNASTWPVLEDKLVIEERTRRHLVYAKILEIAAILIALLTFYNFFPTLRTTIAHTKNAPVTIRPDHAMSAPVATAEIIASPQHQAADVLSDVHQSASQINAHARSPVIPSVTEDGSMAVAVPSPLTQTRPWVSVAPIFAGLTPLPVADRIAAVVHPASGGSPESSGRQRGRLSLQPMNGLLAAAGMPLMAAVDIVPVLPRHSKTRFGMMAAADVNTLYIPEENFYSQGRAIHFSEKEIVAGGYTAGATLLFDKKKFLVETGLIYSSKSFQPDRNLFIGSSQDPHSLDFENITLNVISVPCYLHLKVDGKGLWRVYATGGLSLNVIANAHYDLFAQNDFAASAAPADPLQLQNQREVKRVREHMLDGAKFSSKGYLTASTGVGVEHFLNANMSLFVEPMYHYQIPFFKLIDQNGKHLQNGSIFLGTRVSL